MASAGDGTGEDPQSKLLHIDNDYTFEVQLADFLRKERDVSTLQGRDAISAEDIQQQLDMLPELAEKLYKKLLAPAADSITYDQIQLFLRPKKIHRRKSEHDAAWVRELLTHVDWREMDEDGSMQVERDEFIHFFGQRMDIKLAEAIFDTIDANGDGSLTALEYFRWRTGVSVESIEELMLKVLGTSKDAYGVIEEEPVATGVKVDVGAPSDDSPPDGAKSPRNVDDDAALAYEVIKSTPWQEVAGDDMILERDEFIKFFDGTSLTIDTINRIFGMMDRNGDNHVSGAEFFQWKTSLTVDDIRRAISGDDLPAEDQKDNDEVPPPEPEPEQPAEEPEPEPVAAAEPQPKPVVEVPSQPEQYEPEPEFNADQMSPVVADPPQATEPEPQPDPEPVSPPEPEPATEKADLPPPSPAYESEDPDTTMSPLPSEEEKTQQQDTIPLREEPSKRDSLLDDTEEALRTLRRNRTKSKENFDRQNKATLAEEAAAAEQTDVPADDVPPDNQPAATKAEEEKPAEDAAPVRRMWIKSKRGEHWREVEVVGEDGENLTVHYVNYASKYDEVIKADDPRLRDKRPMTGFIPGDNLSCWNDELGQWREAEIKKVDKETDRVLVHYVSSNINRDEWLPMNDPRLSAVHKNPFETGPNLVKETDNTDEDLREAEAARTCNCVFL